MTENKEKRALTTSDAILGFVPAIVVQSFIDSMKKKIVRELPWKQSFRSIVMFADISGFTMLTETLSKIGPEGAEVIAFALNRYMELLVKEIMRCGGDILKFAGDAMIIVWPPPQTENEREYNNELQTYLRQAIQTCLDIQAKLNDTFILENIKLSVKVGFGIGDISIIYVGGEFNRSEYLATGDPLTMAFECEHHATSGGQSIISEIVYQNVKEFFQCEKILEVGDHKSEHGPFYFVKGIAKNSRKIQITKNPLKIIKDNLSHQIFEQIKPEMMNYIPAALLPYVQVDQERWSAELRRATIMFVNLGIDLTDAKTLEGLKQIQIVIRTVQKCVYKFQGSLNKLLMDDKGSTLIVVFGLPPMAHQDDPVRAVATAATMRHELERINCKCNIGIGTGMIFAGVVGTSGSRREYSVLGDSVNLSARLMQAACSDPDKKIIIDEATAQESVQKIPARFYKTIKVKGKEADIPIYEPLMLTFDLIKQIFNTQGRICFNFLRTHNPTYPQKINPSKMSYVGKAQLQEEIIRVLDAYLSQMIPKALVQIRGTYGIGKSLTVHVALNTIVQRISSGSYPKLKYEEKAEIICANVGPFHKDKNFNSIRLIVQQIILMYCRRHKLEASEELIGQLIVHDDIPHEDWNAFISLFDMSETSWIEDFPPKMIAPRQTLLRSIKRLVSQLIAIFVEEEPECLKGLVPHEAQGLRPSQLFLVCDDVQYYDALSFKVLKKVSKCFKHCLLLLIIRDEFLEPPVFQMRNAPTQAQIIIEGLQDIESSFTPQQIHSLKVSSLKKRGKTDQIYDLIKQEYGVKDFALQKGKIKQLSQNLSKKNTKLSVEEQKSMASPFMFEQNRNLLLSNDINQLFINFITMKTKGNPLTVMHYFKQLTVSKLLKIEVQTATLSQQLEDMIYMDETSTIDIPIDRIRANQPLFDKLSCFENILLKVASVIGDIFDIQTLNKVQPLKNQLNTEKIIKIMRGLDDKNIIELMEINDVTIFYRFTCPFMRESIYQTMIFSQRRELHRYVAQALQEKPQEYDYQQDIEQLKLQFHLTLSEQKWSLNKQSTSAQTLFQDLSHKAKRSMIVKKIQQTLVKHRANPSTVIMKGQLEKKSDVNVSWAQRYCLMTIKDFRYFYTPEDYRKDPDNPLGIIPLKAVYTILPLNDKEEVNKPNSFSMSTSMWIKKQTEMDERKFFFSGANADITEEWTIYLEFARSMAIYDQFVLNFGRINFPLGQTSEYYDIDLGYQISSFENKQTILTKKRDDKVQPLHQQYINAQKRESLNHRQRKIQIYQWYLNHRWKEQLKVFLSKSLLLVYSHMFEMSISPSTGYTKQFGQKTKAMIKFKQFFTIDPKLLAFSPQHRQSQFFQLEDIGRKQPQSTKKDNITLKQIQWEEEKSEPQDNKKQLKSQESLELRDQTILRNKEQPHKQSFEVSPSLFGFSAEKAHKPLEQSHHSDFIRIPHPSSSKTAHQQVPAFYQGSTQLAAQPHGHHNLNNNQSGNHNHDTHSPTSQSMTSRATPRRMFDQENSHDGKIKEFGRNNRLDLTSNHGRQSDSMISQDISKIDIKKDHVAPQFKQFFENEESIIEPPFNPTPKHQTIDQSMRDSLANDFSEKSLEIIKSVEKTMDYEILPIVKVPQGALQRAQMSGLDRRQKGEKEKSRNKTSQQTSRGKHELEQKPENDTILLDLDERKFSPHSKFQQPQLAGKKSQEKATGRQLNQSLEPKYTFEQDKNHQFSKDVGQASSNQPKSIGSFNLSESVQSKKFADTSHEIKKNEVHNTSTTFQNNNLILNTQNKLQRQDQNQRVAQQNPSTTHNQIDKNQITLGNSKLVLNTSYTYEENKSGLKMSQNNQKYQYFESSSDKLLNNLRIISQKLKLPHFNKTPRLVNLPLGNKQISDSTYEFKNGKFSKNQTMDSSNQKSLGESRSPFRR